MADDVYNKYLRYCSKREKDRISKEKRRKSRSSSSPRKKSEKPRGKSASSQDRELASNIPVANPSPIAKNIIVHTQVDGSKSISFICICVTWKILLKFDRCIICQENHSRRLFNMN